LSHPRKNSYHLVAEQLFARNRMFQAHGRGARARADDAFSKRRPSGAEGASGQGEYGYRAYDENAADD
jgi:hypothetical protein